MIFFVGLIAGIFVMCLMSAAENRDLVELSDICKKLLVEAKTDMEEALLSQMYKCLVCKHFQRNKDESLDSPSLPREMHFYNSGPLYIN